jgi:hypothetical protein
MRILSPSAAEVASPRTRRGRLVAIAAACALVVPLVVGVAPSAASHEPPACTTVDGPGPLCLQVSDTPDPVSYSTFDGNQSYIEYTATAENQASETTLPNVVIDQDLPIDNGSTLLSYSYSGSGLVDYQTSQGTCSTEGSMLYCDIGDLGPGETATVTAVVSAPESSSSNPEDSLVMDYATASFYFPNEGEGYYDQVSYDEDTTVSSSAGQTFVAQGDDAKVGTDPDADQYANVTITNASVDLLASIEILPPDNFCQDGRVRVGFSVYVCRDGSFVHASVTQADSGAPYYNAADPLVFHLRWNADLVSPLQTKRNFVTFYQSQAGARTKVIKKRCGGFFPKLPCLENITKHGDGSWSVDLVKPDNGRMR